MYDDFSIIAKNIKYLREKKGYTQEQLAEAANLSVSHVSKVEAGQRRIGMKSYLAILNALNVNEEDFVSLVAIGKSDNYIEKIQEILHGCNEGEKKFLLNILTYIKQNMEMLKKINKQYEPQSAVME